MTDKELIQALRCCGVGQSCKKCPANSECYKVSYKYAADRLEAMLAENERLKAQLPKWVSVKERMPHFNQPYIVTACDENAPAGEGIWYSTVVVVAEYYNGCWTWYEGETEYDLTGLVTHWQPLPESPSTEGVE